MNNYKPFVTIITNTKNRSNLISRCIESIQKQTYQNYEHIIADGGSDNTKEVVESYKDSHIKYIKVPKGGPVAQTREAFRISKGEFITFLDDDDEYLPEKIEKQLELITSLSDDYGFIYGSMKYYDNNTQKYVSEHSAEIEGGKELLPIAISSPVICGTPTLMFRRNVFESIGGTWISGIGNEMSDWALGCKALKQGWKVAALKESYLKIYINHISVRMSDSNFYQDSSERYIKFHSYFLSEYADVIKKYPESAVIHYESLIHNYISVGKIIKAFGYWKKLISVKFNFRSLLLFPYYILKSNTLKHFMLM